VLALVSRSLSDLISHPKCFGNKFILVPVYLLGEVFFSQRVFTVLQSNCLELSL
jgi:hypothetical protein